MGEDRSALVWQVGVAFLILGLAAYGLRCVDRLRTTGWGKDDWAVSLVVIILIPMCAITIPRTLPLENTKDNVADTGRITTWVRKGYVDS